MGLFRTLLTFPVSAPMQGSLWVARKLHEAAENEYHDAGAIRRQLADLENALLAGEISEDTYDEAEEHLLLRLRDART